MAIKKSLVSTLKSCSQASFNYFYQIAVHSDKIRFPQNNSMEQIVAFAMQQAHSINGISDAARYDIISYSREHLNFIPVKEHPARPFPEVLPKPIKKRKTVHNNAKERGRINFHKQAHRFGSNLFDLKAQKSKE